MRPPPLRAQNLSRRCAAVQPGASGRSVGSAFGSGWPVPGARPVPARSGAARAYGTDCLASASSDWILQQLAGCCAAQGDGCRTEVLNRSPRAGNAMNSTRARRLGGREGSGTQQPEVWCHSILRIETPCSTTVCSGLACPTLPPAADVEGARRTGWMWLGKRPARSTTVSSTRITGRSLGDDLYADTNYAQLPKPIITDDRNE